MAELQSEQLKKQQPDLAETEVIHQNSFGVVNVLESVEPAVQAFAGAIDYESSEQDEMEQHNAGLQSSRGLPLLQQQYGVEVAQPPEERLDTATNVLTTDAGYLMTEQDQLNFNGNDNALLEMLDLAQDQRSGGESQAQQSGQHRSSKQSSERRRNLFEDSSFGIPVQQQSSERPFGSEVRFGGSSNSGAPQNLTDEEIAQHQLSETRRRRQIQQANIERREREQRRSPFFYHDRRSLNVNGAQQQSRLSLARFRPPQRVSDPGFNPFGQLHEEQQEMRTLTFTKKKAVNNSYQVVESRPETTTVAAKKDKRLKMSISKILMALQAVAAILQGTTVALIFLTRQGTSRLPLDRDFVFISFAIVTLVAINCGVMVLCFRRKRYICLSSLAEMGYLVLFALIVFRIIEERRPNSELALSEAQVQEFRLFTVISACLVIARALVFIAQFTMIFFKLKR